MCLLRAQYVNPAHTFIRIRTYLRSIWSFGMVLYFMSTGVHPHNVRASLFHIIHTLVLPIKKNDFFEAVGSYYEVATPLRKHVATHHVCVILCAQTACYCESKHSSVRSTKCDSPHMFISHIFKRLYMFPRHMCCNVTYIPAAHKAPCLNRNFAIRRESQSCQSKPNHIFGSGLLLSRIL
jgi:hypothetical protein